MEKQIVLIDAQREGCSTDQIRHTMTVAELIAELEQYDDDAPVVHVFDGGYTYGSIAALDIEEDVINEEEE